MAGGIIYLLAGYRLDHNVIDVKFGVIAVLTIVLSSRVSIRIPQFDSQISVSDTFIFLILLLYGYEAAILMAATEAFVSSFRFCRKWSTVLFNWGCAAWSACVTSYCLGSSPSGTSYAWRPFPCRPHLSRHVALMALIQYVTNSGVVAVCGALQAARPSGKHGRSITSGRPSPTLPGPPPPLLSQN